MFEDVKALAFDVGGSVFDWQTAVKAKARELAATHDVTLDDHEFAHTWRRRMFQMLSEVRKGDRERLNADEIHRVALDELAPKFGIPLTDGEKDDLTHVWHHMDVWDDFPAALTRLRGSYKVNILSVLSFSILVDSSKHAGISWDGLISCEFLTHYKPEPEAYQQGARLLGLPPNQVMMVAVHPGDLSAAAAAGMRTGFVKPKVDEAGSAGDPSGFDIQAEDYTDFAEQMCG
jgi:2-haloacid dehalogenase